MRKTLLFSLILTLFWISTSFAQGLPQDIDISIYPIEPKPGQEISAKVSSFGMDLSSATITWKYNNTTLSVGTGKTTVNFKAPSSSTTSVLYVSASGTEGFAETSIIIRSASVDVIWEATDSYTPPFYKGKALPAVGAKLKIAAIPSITAPKNMSYNWRYNGNAIQNQSGTNKDSLSIKTDVLGSNESFSVVIGSNSFSGSGSTQVTLRDPNIVMYQKSNGFIDYTKGSLKDIFITLPGVTLRVEPFNFTIAKSIEESLSIGFKLNDQSFIGTANSQELSITRPANAGQGSISATVTSIKERLQQVSRSFNLNF